MSEAEAERADASDDNPPDLVDVLEAFATSYDCASTHDERRGAGLQQLMHITLHLQRAGIPAEALRPVTALMDGLIDVDRGCIPPILQAQRKAGAPPIPSDELRQRGLAAAAVTLFMQADKAAGHDGQKLDRAVRRVARRIPHWRAARRHMTKSRSQSLVEAIKDWREKAMSGDPETDWAASKYTAMLREAAANGWPPAQGAEWALTKGHALYR